MEQVPYALAGAVATYSAKSALFTATYADQGTFFDSTGSFTITLDTSGMSAGWSAWFRCVSGTQTLDPTSTTQINGATTYAISNAGDGVLVTYTGSAFVVTHTQRPSTVAITGGTIDNTTIGATTATTGRFTTVTATGLTSGRLTYATTNGLLTDTATISTNGTRLDVGDGSTSNANIIHNGVAANGSGFFIRVAGNNRWGFLKNSTAESGSDAGSDFSYNAYTDAGALIDAPISIIRAGGGAITFARRCVTTASSTTRAYLNLPHGSAPSSPVDGDLWTTSAGLYVRINGVTVGPLT